MLEGFPRHIPNYIVYIAQSSVLFTLTQIVVNPASQGLRHQVDYGGINLGDAM